MGWIAAIIFIIALIGNIWLFTGDFFDGSGIFIAIAIIVDLLLVAYVCYTIHHTLETKKQAAKNQEVAIELQKIAAENQQLSLKIKAIVDANNPVGSVSIHNGIPLDFPEINIDHELLFHIMRFKYDYDESVKKCLETNDRLLRLLSCPDCNSLAMKLDYLNTNIEQIKRLKAESDKQFNQIGTLRFPIPNNSNFQALLFRAFSLLQESKKYSFDEGTIETVVNNCHPTDISLFDLKEPIITLKVEKNYYCLLGETIVVFDENGYFSTVLKKSVLKIEVKKEIGGLYSYVASDSKLVKGGLLTYTWLHTCVDGSPDMRYNYNPRIPQMKDGYEYGVVTISIAAKKIRITVSSQKAIEAFEELARIMK